MNPQIITAFDLILVHYTHYLFSFENSVEPNQLAFNEAS